MLTAPRAPLGNHLVLPLMSRSLVNEADELLTRTVSDGRTDVRRRVEYGYTYSNARLPFFTRTLRCFYCGDKVDESHSEPFSDKCFLITVTDQRAQKQKLWVKMVLIFSCMAEDLIEAL